MSDYAKRAPAFGICVMHMNKKLTTHVYEGRITIKHTRSVSNHYVGHLELI